MDSRKAIRWWRQITGRGVVIGVLCQGFDERGVCVGGGGGGRKGAGGGVICKILWRTITTIIIIIMGSWTVDSLIDTGPKLLHIL